MQQDQFPQATHVVSSSKNASVSPLPNTESVIVSTKDQLDSNDQLTGYAVPPGMSSPKLNPANCRVKDFLCAFFGLLDEHEVRYCVLHTWEGLPEELPSDLDIAVHPHDRAKLPAVFGALRDLGFLPVQCLNYFVNGYYFVFYWFHNLGLQSVAVDVIFEHRRRGMILTPGKILVAGRRRHGLFWIPNPEVQLHYLLAKKTLKGSTLPNTVRQIKSLIEEVGHSQAEKIVTDLYGAKWKKRIVNACLDGTLPGILNQLPRSLRWTLIRRHPFAPIRYFYSDSLRRIQRWFQPTGLFVVVLGLDGVGKSTIVEQLVDKLGPAFRRHRIFHFRPQLIKPHLETGVPETDPHGKPVRGAARSVARLLGFFADFWAGYLFVIRPLLACSGLVIFDRYFHDIMIDQKRYRYGGPLWLPRVLARFIPPLDLLFLVLDAEVDVILSRKREVVPEEMKRLQSLYIKMTSETSQAHLIKTDEGIERSSAAASRALVLYLAERFERRHGSWLARDNSVAREGKPAEATQP
jgi:thymidylate kinase